jgi:hypothetical protein
MLRLTSLRFTFAVCTLFAASMDTATKLLHGIVHEHESLANVHTVWRDESATHAPPIPGDHAEEVEAADTADHGHAALHEGANACLLKISPAAPASPPVLGPAPGTSNRRPQIPLKDELPASERAGPRHSRAPPVA